MPAMSSSAPDGGSGDIRFEGNLPHGHGRLFRRRTGGVRFFEALRLLFRLFRLRGVGEARGEPAAELLLLFGKAAVLRRERGVQPFSRTMLSCAEESSSVSGTPPENFRPSASSRASSCAVKVRFSETARSSSSLPASANAFSASSAEGTPKGYFSSSAAIFFVCSAAEAHSRRSAPSSQTRRCASAPRRSPRQARVSVCSFR